MLLASTQNLEFNLLTSLLGWEELGDCQSIRDQSLAIIILQLHLSLLELKKIKNLKDK